MELFILGSVQSIIRNLYFGLAFVVMSIQIVAATQKECANTKYLQIKQEY